MKDGIIKIDTEDGKVLGLTSDKFEAFSYLWKDGNKIFISMIQSVKEKRGDFKALVSKILSLNFTVLIPTPLGRMEYIVRKNGYIKTSHQTDIGPCEVWEFNP